MKSRIQEIISVTFGINCWNTIRQPLYNIQDRKSGIKNILNINAEFHDLYKDQRCFIIGNGPSSNNIDTELLENEILFTVNLFPKAEVYQRLTPRFHLWADERFFDLDDNDLGDMEVLKVMKTVKNAICSPTIFYKVCAKNMIEKYNLDKELNIRYFADGGAFDGKFSGKIDITTHIPWFPTVVQYGIALAIYMGFKEIYLLGCECTGFINLAKAKDSKMNEKDVYAFKMSEVGRDRFNRVMNETSSADEMFVHYQILRYYEYLKKYCDKKKIVLANCTEGGILDSLPRVPLSSIIKSEI